MKLQYRNMFIREERMIDMLFNFTSDQIYDYLHQFDRKPTNLKPEAGIEEETARLNDRGKLNNARKALGLPEVDTHQ